MLQFTIWNVIALFGAGAIAVALGATIAGFLAYKIKYAGRDLFHVEHLPKAEAFNIDDDFIDKEDVEDPTAPENQKEIRESQAAFIKQFTLDRILKAGDTKAAVEEAP